MDLFFHAALTKHKRRAHFHGFMIDVHKRMHAVKISKGTKYDAVPDVARDLAKDAWLLCFDEMQVTDIAGGLRDGRVSVHQDRSVAHGLSPSLLSDSSCTFFTT
jgi:hypothetical protein